MTPHYLTNIFPIENFASFSAMQGDRAVAGSFNMGYRKHEMKDKYPWCLKIAIALDSNNLSSNGLPNDIELIIVGKVEDELLADKTEKLIEDYLCAEREPLRDEVLELIEVEKPSLLQSKKIGDGILKRIMNFIETFINEMSNR